MPSDNVAKIAAVPGVQSVSAQLYLASLYGASCCAVSEMFMVVYDPKTDFTVTPWLEKNLGRGLNKGEVIAALMYLCRTGTRASNSTVIHNIERQPEATGTGIDQTMS